MSSLRRRTVTKCKQLVTVSHFPISAPAAHCIILTYWCKCCRECFVNFQSHSVRFIIYAICNVYIMVYNHTWELVETNCIIMYMYYPVCPEHIQCIWCTFHSLLVTLAPLDGFPVVYIATAESVIPVMYKVDPSGSENWEPLQDQALDIPGATALDVDVVENYIYWINMAEKVLSTHSYSLHVSKDCVFTCTCTRV